MAAMMNRSNEPLSGLIEMMKSSFKNTPNKFL